MKRILMAFCLLLPGVFSISPVLADVDVTS